MMQQIDVFEINLLPKQPSETLLREMLAKHLQIPAEELVIERGEFGKPYLRDFPEWYFNLSHSGEKCYWQLVITSQLALILSV